MAEEPAVEACLKAAETGVLGPFAFAEDDEGSVTEGIFVNPPWSVTVITVTAE